MENSSDGISSQYLMHFVDEKEYLVKILNHNFYPRLCCEDLIKPFFKTNVYVPMKCFCDIPMEHLGEHIKTYGQYGIGFKKSWGERAGLTPVIYYNENSPYIQNMKVLYDEQIYRLNKSRDDAERSMIIEMIRILKSSFTMYKPIYGDYKRKLEVRKNYCFYNEREWRYVLPAIENTAYLQGDNFPQKVIEIYNGFEKNNEWNPGKLELKNQIEFTYDDIDFIIIPDSCEISEIIKELTVSEPDVEEIKNKIKTLRALIEEKN